MCARFIHILYLFCTVLLYSVWPITEVWSSQLLYQKKAWKVSHSTFTKTWTLQTRWLLFHIYLTQILLKDWHFYINHKHSNKKFRHRQLVSEKMSGKRIKTAPYGKQKRMLVAQTTSSSCTILSRYKLFPNITYRVQTTQ